MVLDGSQSQIYQIQPPDFFPIGPSFQRYITVKFRQAAPSSDYFGHLYPLYEMARKGVQVCGTFTLQAHVRPQNQDIYENTNTSKQCSGNNFQILRSML